MNEEQFTTKVAEMRKTQIEYFRTRDPRILRKSKALEAEIDREIARRQQTKAAETHRALNPSLFGGIDQ